MRHSRLQMMVALLAVGVLFGATAGVGAQEAGQGSSADQQQAIEAYMKLMMAPNENHAVLKNFVGTWDVASKGWMQPGTEPSVSQGVSTGEMILGGRFVRISFQGTMFGQHFEGLQIVGFDTLKHRLMTFWIDTSSTAFYLMEGAIDSTLTVLTSTALWPDPMTGGTVRVRDVTTFVSPDAYTYEMYMTGADGKEFKTVENIAVRRKTESPK